MDEIDKGRYRELLVWWLLLHENIYHQWKKKLLDQETYVAWENDLKNFVSAQHLDQRWAQVKVNLEPSFVEHVSQLITEQATISQPTAPQQAKFENL